jgi:hypothetical protein
LTEGNPPVILNWGEIQSPENQPAGRPQTEHPRMAPHHGFEQGLKEIVKECF